MQPLELQEEAELHRHHCHRGPVAITQLTTPNWKTSIAAFEPVSETELCDGRFFYAVKESDCLQYVCVCVCVSVCVAKCVPLMQKVPQ